jgi:hydroxylamine reductase
VADLQDLLIFVLKGIGVWYEKLEGVASEHPLGEDDFTPFALFATITNTNFSKKDLEGLVKEALEHREEVREAFETAYQSEQGEEFTAAVPDAAVWRPSDTSELYEKSAEVGVLATENEDVRSLRELMTYGMKGIAAYLHHAQVLGKPGREITSFLHKGLAATVDNSLGLDELVDLVLETGDVAVKTMALLDEANTEEYGHPEPTEINIGTRDRPGILVSGHDLKDLEDLLKQTEGTGVDVYTHGEMLPANAYPAFKEFDHFVGNYGNAWRLQTKEFDSFNGPVLLTTNCLVPPKDSYADRIYTTGPVGYEGLTHIEKPVKGGPKDFSAVIEHAKSCTPPEQLEEGTIPGGFAHNALTNSAGKIVEAVKSGAISKFVVMAGCDGRHSSREYFTELAEELPEDTVILTAGCAKYRYNKLGLGDIDGIPRMIDAGQCNDSYSLVVIAQKLAEALEFEDINELPIEFDLAWYEQKAVAVLLALLSLGIKGMRLGPTLPAFVSPNVLQVLVDNFDMKPTRTVEEDLEAIIAD